jgi:hypothetical protein
MALSLPKSPRHKRLSALSSDGETRGTPGISLPSRGCLRRWLTR